MKIEIVISFIIFFSISCKDSTNQRRSELEKIVFEWHNKEIFFPDSIYTIHNGNIEIVEINPLSSNNYKILTLISGDCEKCLLDANKWCILLDTISKITPLDFLPVFITSDYNHFIKYYQKRLPNCFEPLLDIHFKFLLDYNLPEDWGLRTFLLDKNNRIIIIGNPIYNINIKNLLMKIILENE